MNKDKIRRNMPNQQNKFHASHRLLGLVGSYVDDERVQNDVVEAYQAKKPKPYAHVFNGLFRFSKITLFAFHTLSFLIATPLIFSLAFQFLLRRDPAEIKTLFDSIVQEPSNILQPVFLIPAVVTCGILWLLEYGQHVTLNSLFDIYFQWQKVVIGLAILAALFSIASVSTSGLGAKEFVYVAKSVDPASVGEIDKQIDEALALRNKHSDRSNSIIKQRDAEVAYLREQKALMMSDNKGTVEGYSKIMIAISLFFEIMIITNTFNIHNYQFKTARETQMINDLRAGEHAAPLNVQTTYPPYSNGSIPKTKEKTPVLNGNSKKKLNGQRLHT